MPSWARSRSFCFDRRITRAGSTSRPPSLARINTQRTSMPSQKGIFWGLRPVCLKLWQRRAMVEKGCSVSSPKPTILECTNKGNQLVARLTENMSPNVVTAVSYIFQFGAPTQELVGIISAQFHIRPFNRIWHLSNSSTMQLDQYSTERRSANSPIPSWVLIINEPRFLDQDRDVLLEKQRAAVPPPKF